MDCRVESGWNPSQVYHWITMPPQTDRVDEWPRMNTRELSVEVDLVAVHIGRLISGNGHQDRPDLNRFRREANRERWPLGEVDRHAITSHWTLHNDRLERDALIDVETDARRELHPLAIHNVDDALQVYGSTLRNVPLIADRIVGLVLIDTLVCCLTGPK